MRFSWKWLFEIYGINPGPKEWQRIVELRSQLPLSGIEIAKIENKGASLDDILVARVLDVQKHPQADRLNLCQVNNGKETLQIVCGASNVRAGINIALAPVGAKLPNGMEIKAAKIRGVDSSGMICSESELGLAAESEGILVLPEALVAGQKFLDAVEVRDEVWELELTPDRADCLSVLGVARELRRYWGEAGEWPELKWPERDLLENEAASDVPLIKVEVQSLEACPLYTAQLFESFTKNSYSSIFEERLKSLGVERLKTPIVDLANYVLFELGHPTHTFDADEIVGSKLIVRFAKNGEKIITLDGIERTLVSEDLIIADMEKPVALAGVMGSATSGVTEKTKRVLVESALFNPEYVQATAKRHKIVSDAAHRFERGVNPQGVFEAIGRVSLLFRTQLGAKKKSSLIVVKAPKSERLFESKAINLDLRKLERTLGYFIESEDVAQALLSTGIKSQPKTSNILTVEVPTYRGDLLREIDLVEEVARVTGYDKIPLRYPTQKESFAGVATGLFDRWQSLRLLALQSSYVEVAPYAFISEDERKVFVPTVKAQALANPISDDWKYLRPTLTCALVSNLSRHGSLRQKDVSIFECGTVFEKATQVDTLKNKNLKTKESLHLAWATMGLREDSTWLQDKASKQRDEYRNFYDAKGFWEFLHQDLANTDGRWRNVELKAIYKLSDKDKEQVPAWIPLTALHPGRSALIYVPALRSFRGYVGELHPTVFQKVMNLPAGWKFPVALGELRIFEDLWNWTNPQVLLDKLGAKSQSKIRPPVSLPVVERDLSFVVDNSIQHDELYKAISKTAKDLVGLKCIDLYPMEGGKKSLSFRLLLQAADRTLQDNEIQENIATVLKDLSKNFNASLRA